MVLSEAVSGSRSTTVLRTVHSCEDAVQRKYSKSVKYKFIDGRELFST